MSKSYRLSLNARIFKLELGCFLKLCEATNTPRSQTCHMLASNAEWDQYLALDFPDPLTPTFADDYAMTEAMRKNPRLPTTIDTKKVALEKWFSAEEQCKVTNNKLRGYQQGDTSCIPNDKVERVLNRTRSLIATVLGELTPTKLDYLYSKCRFGPGATSSCSGTDVVLSRKMTSVMEVTPRLYPYWRSLTNGRWSDVITEVKLRASSKVTFVPKDAKTDRAIAIEPHVNIFMQLGIGALLRRQLSTHLFDLDSQADKNRLLASRAQSESLSTIDLSSASDTIASELVWCLLPFDWAALLDLPRTEYSDVEGTEVRLEKFSSMGNGYTFELESLIFACLARASGDPDAVSFGDDIICNAITAPLLLEVLEYLGFKVNERKTFLAGTFFESCGTDYWHGVNVRPPIFKGEYNDFTSAVIRTANKVRLYAHRRRHNYGCDIRFLNAWLHAISGCSTARKTGIPIRASSSANQPFWDGQRIVFHRKGETTAGDDGLIRNFDEFTPRRNRYGLDGYQAKVWRHQPRRSIATHEAGAYIASLAWGSTIRSRLDEDQRNSIASSALSHQIVPSWCDLGPWF